MRPTDVIYEYRQGPDGRPVLPGVQISPTYPYGSFLPAPGAIVTALVTRNGVAYDLSDMPTSTRLSATTQSLAKGAPKP